MKGKSDDSYALDANVGYLLQDIESALTATTSIIELIDLMNTLSDGKAPEAKVSKYRQASYKHEKAINKIAKTLADAIEEEFNPKRRPKS